MLIPKMIDKTSMKLSDVRYEQCGVYKSNATVWIAYYLGDTIAIEDSEERCKEEAKRVFNKIKNGELVLWKSEFE